MVYRFLGIIFVMNLILSFCFRKRMSEFFLSICKENGVPTESKKLFKDVSLAKFLVGKVKPEIHTSKDSQSVIPFFCVCKSTVAYSKLSVAMQVIKFMCLSYVRKPLLE